MKRVTRDTLFLSIAKLFALRSTCSRLSVGAVIVKNKRIISSGYNGPPAGEPHCNDCTCNPKEPCKRAIHAEANAIKWAMDNNIDLIGGTLYCTHLPCTNCATKIVKSGISKVVYSEDYRDSKGLLILRTPVTCSHTLMYLHFTTGCIPSFSGKALEELVEPLPRVSLTLEYTQSVTALLFCTTKAYICWLSFCIVLFWDSKHLSNPSTHPSKNERIYVFFLSKPSYSFHDCLAIPRILGIH